MKRVLIYFLFLGLWAYPNLAETKLDPRGERSINYWSRYGAVRLESERIRFHENEQIKIAVKVQNRGYQNIRIYPFSLYQKTFQLFVTDKQGREVPQQFNEDSYNNREKGDLIVHLQGEAKKEIILSPQESFEKILYVNDFYQLQADKEYRLWLYFHPDQSRNNFFVRSENMIRLHIVSNNQIQRRNEMYQQQTSQKNLGLSPEETLYLFLSAEVQKKWSNYIKYIDLKKFIHSYPHYASRYAQVQTAEKRSLVLEDFSQFLTQSPADQLIRFKITDSEPERNANGKIIVNGNRYFVTASGTREALGSIARYEYNYTLEAQPYGFWKIIYVEAKLIR